MTFNQSHYSNKRELVESSADQLEAAKLVLYKNLASNLETKKTYMYLQMTPSQTTISPYLLGQNAGKVYKDPLASNSEVVPAQVNPYYSGLGTKRTVDIRGFLEAVTGHRVEDNRFKFQIDLETVEIEQDLKGWQNIRHYGTLRQPDGEFELYRTYDVVNRYAEESTIPAGAEQNIINVFFQEALKTTNPEPLFIRINELANSNQPYHFLSQPSGVVSTTNGQQPIMIDSLVKTPTFTIEFGHLVFKGVDQDYQRALDVFAPENVPSANEQLKTLNNPQVTLPISQYRDFEYLEYNEEHYNNSNVEQPTPLNTDNRYVAPCSRPEYIELTKDQIDGSLPADPVRIRTQPLFSNQQASKISMRFAISWIPLF